jgi:hypothetical protein
MKLRSTIRRVQQLENSAADKAGVLFMASDESQYQSKAYRTDLINRILRAIAPEIIESAEAGKKLLKEVQA